MINAESLKRWTLASLLAAACAVPQLVFAQPFFKRIVVFGTSLSDPGNAYAVLGEATSPPRYAVDDSLIPFQPYKRGGHHFTNGATWVEQFARPLGLAAGVRPAFAGFPRATNYAFGGARARPSGDSPHLTLQVGAFLSTFGGSAPADALYVVEMGSNDIRDALLFVLGGGDLPDAFDILEDAAQSIKDNIELLSAVGATQFLVWNGPDIGLTPALRGSGAEPLAALLTSAFNSKLDGKLAGLAGIVRLNVYEKLYELVGSPATFGLTNVTDACITIVAPFTCSNPADYLFWDGIHPSAAGHAIISHEATRVLVQ